jgi:hypothetical protein
MTNAGEDLSLKSPGNFCFDSLPFWNIIAERHEAGALVRAKISSAFH